MGMVIVESGWGSLIPTVVVANMSPFGAAARSGKLNIGDQIMAINGTSLVGLPLHECQNVIKVTMGRVTTSSDGDGLQSDNSIYLKSFINIMSTNTALPMSFTDLTE